MNLASPMLHTSPHGRSGPLRAAVTGPRPAVKVITEAFRDLLAPAAAVSAIGLVLVPAGRLAAWLCLLIATVAIARLRDRLAGIAAAVSASMIFLLAHGRPRFAGTVTDPWTIRLGFLLGLAGAVGALAVTAHNTREETDVRPHGDALVAPAVATVVNAGCGPRRTWTVTLVVAGRGAIEPDLGVALRRELREDRGSVCGGGTHPVTGVTRLGATLVVDQADGDGLDAARHGLDRFRRAAKKVGVPDWPVVEIGVERDEADERWE